jgi:uncharacterized RDD family membrane protein YckC
MTGDKMPIYCTSCGTPNEDSANFCRKCGGKLSNVDSSLSFVKPYVQERYAGFWLRFWASILDNIILLIPDTLLYYLVIFPTFFSEDDNSGLTEYYIISILIYWVYFAIFESSAKQATLGKMALKIKVTDLNGNRISFGKATGRHFSKFFSAIIIGIGFLMAGFTEKKQALHDMISGCLVVRN